MLWKFTNKNKYGNLRGRIIYHPDGQPFTVGKGFGDFVGVSVFKYKYEHSLIPPHLFTDRDGKKFIVPEWREVLPETTINDIEWVKPKIKVIKKSEKIIVKTPSSKGDTEYITTYYPDTNKYHCTCPGTWRTGGNCKHIKKLNNEI